MSVGYRAMRPGQEDAVAALVRQMPKDIGRAAAVKLSGDGLRKAKDLVHVHVAEDSGLILGVCLWLMTYSTWRGAPGMYVVDLFVMSHVRGKRLGERLLQAAAKAAHKRGAEFIKLEVDENNTGAARFYDRLHFGKHPEDQLCILENEPMNTFLNRSIP